MRAGDEPTSSDPLARAMDQEVVTLQSAPWAPKPWIVALGAFLCLCVLPFAYCAREGTAPDMFATEKRVALGTRLSQLDDLAEGGYSSSSDVAEWQIATPAQQGNERYFENEFGHFIVKDLGRFHAWKASDVERDQFTGEIRLTWNDFRADVLLDGSHPSYTISYIYVDGVLRAKWLHPHPN